MPILFATMLFLAAWLPSKAAAQSLDESAIQEIRALVNQAVAAKTFAGAAVAIIEGNQFLLLEGFGTRNIDTGDPVTPLTLFHMGSMNKALTSLLVATQVDAGKLHWAQPVVEVYPSFALADSRYTPSVEAQHLMNMTSGVDPNGPASEDFEVSRPARDVFIAIQADPPINAPGVLFAYSNLTSAASGYLAVIAEYGYGEEIMNQLHSLYGSLLKQRLLEPMGMLTATLSVTEARSSADFSVSHESENGQLVVSQSVDIDVDALAPSGGLKVNATEMGYYLMTEIRRGVTPSGVSIVSEDNVTKRWQAYPGVIDGGDYGMGWETLNREGIASYEHGGSFDNFNNHMGIMPGYNLGFVILTNSETDSVLEFTSKTFPAKIASLLKTGTPNFTLSVSNSGQGRVTSSPAGIDCGTACSANYAQATSVDLTATPEPNFAFTQWGGACSGSGACTVSMTGNQSVIAMFTGSGGSSCDEGPAWVQKAYIAYYGRPADPAGQDYWADQMRNTGCSLNSIIGPFGTSAEFAERYGSLSATDLVNNLYLNQFGRNAEAAGLAWWVNEYTSGAQSLPQIALSILNGANNEDAEIVANKQQVADYFTSQVRAGCPYGQSAIDTAVGFLAGVTVDVNSVATAKTAIDDYCAN